MNLSKLVINNFKGISHLEIAPEGKSVSVYGENATGKTTIADALTWLLFGKGYDKTNFSPKILKDGQEVHGIDNEVEAEFSLNSGEKVTLRKVFSEVYKKKRGAATAEFSGHTTSYFINSVPTSENEFTDYMKSIMPIMEMQLLSLPSYFPSALTVGERRTLLMKIIGNIADEDVINSNEELQQLNEFLIKPGSNQKYSVDDLMKIVKSRHTEINNQLKLMPARIDEANRALPAEVDIADAANKLVALKAEFSSLNEKKNESKSEAKAELNAKITSKTAELEKYISDYEIAAKKVNADVNNNISNKKAELVTLMSNIAAAKADIQRYKADLDNMKNKRAAALAEYKAVFEKIYSGSDICPCCGQTLPADKVEAAKAAFNEQKSNKLLEINNNGRKHFSKEMISKAEENINIKNAEVEQLNKQIIAIESDISALNEKIKETTPIDQDVKYIELKKSVQILKENYAAESEKANTDNAELISKISKTEDAINKLNKVIALNDNRKKQLDRIAELQADQKKLASSYEKASQVIYLCELFTKTKVDMLTENINSKFSNVKFRLFQQQINGGLKDDCTVLIPCEQGLIPYDTANDAAKVNACLDIIRVLTEHFGHNMPVIVDGAESVTHLQNEGLQVIRLVVSEADKTLRVEREEN